MGTLCMRKGKTETIPPATDREKEVEREKQSTRL